MDYRTLSPRMGDAVASALRHWMYQGKTEQVEPSTTPPWTIAISRQAGADGSGVARAIGQRLGWTVYDRELIEKVAQEAGLHTRLVESVDERRSHWLQECLEAFSSHQSMSELGFLRRVREVITSVASHGECVIVGRGAVHFLPVKTTLRVRLVGTLDERIKAIRRRLNLSSEEAFQFVVETDKGRNQFIRDHFNKNPDDATIYDLTLNACRLGVEGCADVILTALEKMQGYKVVPRKESELVKHN